jgi:hypothetical protein
LKLTLALQRSSSCSSRNKGVQPIIGTQLAHLDEGKIAAPDREVKFCHEVKQNFRAREVKRREWRTS